MKQFFTLFYFSLIINICLAQPIQFEEILPQHPFGPLSHEFKVLVDGNCQFVDLDQDNDLDIVVNGINQQNDPEVKIYINDGLGNYEEGNNTNLIGTRDGEIRFGDINLDSYPDLVITGNDPNNVRSSNLYINDGTGKFSLDTTQNLNDVKNGTADFADLNSDGYLDLVITGGEAGFGSASRIYFNDSTGNLILTPTPTIDHIEGGDISIEDVDNDGDNDILLSGVTVKLYLNDGTGSFSISSATFEDYSDPKHFFSDLDNDNDLDIVITGYNTSSNQTVTDIYLQDSLGTFVKSNTNIQGVLRGSIAHADVDNDSDIDIILTGMPGTFGEYTQLFLNDGNANFSLDTTNDVFAQLYDSYVTFGDINNDNYTDIFLMGKDYFDISQIYVNDSGKYTKAIAYPFEPLDGELEVADLNGDQLKDILTIGFDYKIHKKFYLYQDQGNTTFKRDSNFNIVPGYKGHISTVDADNDGDIDILRAGLIQLVGIYSELFLNDGNGNFTLKSGTPFQGVRNANSVWGDLDGDNDPDLILTGELSNGNEVIKTYRNLGSGNFSSISNFALTGITDGELTLGDIDGDGDLDLMISGYNSTVSIPNRAISRTYFNDGNGQFTFGAHLATRLYKSSQDLADVDGDGDLDFIIFGLEFPSDSMNNFLYLNDGSGNFSPSNNHSFPKLNNVLARFVDFNLDGNVDLYLAGIDSNLNVKNYLYENTGNANFNLISNHKLDAVVDQVEFVDLNQDSVMDVVMMGFNELDQYVGRYYLNTTCINSYTKEIVQACDSFYWGQTAFTYDTSGVYRDTLQNSCGSDSLITLDLTIFKASSSNNVATSCSQYFWQGRNLDSSGVYYDTIPNQMGCDSNITLSLQIYQPTYDSTTIYQCDQYLWQGMNLTQTGIYRDTLQTRHGCDSILSLDLNLTFSTDTTYQVAACDSFLWSYNNQLYTSSGLYSDTLQNYVGCDSIVSLDLTMNRSTFDTSIVSSCDSFFWSFSGLTYSSSGVYVDTLTTQFGCDSLGILDLTIGKSSFSNTNITACNSYTWQHNNTTYNSSGTYIDTTSNSVGCDSIITLNLVINNSSAAVDSITSCNSYTWIDGIKYTNSTNNVFDTLQNQNGCDSIVELALTIPTFDTTIVRNNTTLEVTDSLSTYQWLNCSNGFSILPNDTNQSYTATANGSYAVELTQNNCVDTSRCISVISVGLENRNQNGLENISVYPNPTNQNLTIEDHSNNSDPIIFYFYNSLGQEVKFGQITNGKQTLILNFLKGVYFLELRKQNRMERIKVIVH